MYAYTFDSNSEVDIFGLDCGKPKPKTGPIHHIATNKHSTWSDRFRELFRKNGLGKFKNGNSRKDILNDPLNKVRVPGHKGPHPKEMHQEIFDRLSDASDISSDAFKKELSKLADESVEVGSKMNKILTKM